MSHKSVFFSRVISPVLSGGIFGQGAGKEISKELDLEYLGEINVRADYQDTSRPASLLNNEILEEYRSVTEKTLEALGSK